jgi:hypothetical protein
MARLRTVGTESGHPRGQDTLRYEKTLELRHTMVRPISETVIHGGANKGVHRVPELY